VEGPSAGGAVATAGSRHLLAIYILCFIIGVALGGFLLYFLRRRRRRAAIARHLPKHAISPDKDLLGSTATPQSPSSASFLSDTFALSEKRNGTAMTSLHSTQGNGNGPHGNNNSNSNSSYSSNLISNSSNASGNPGDGHGEPAYVGGGLKLSTDILAADFLDGRTRERGGPGGGETTTTGEEVDEGLGEGLGDSMRGLEEELAKFPLFRSPAPLAKCEESSI